MKASQRERFSPSPKADASTRGYTGGGIVPQIPDIEKALAPLDDAMSAVMAHEYLHGVPKGQTTHYKDLDPIFKWMPGYTTVVTGWSGSGKSKFFFELLLARAVLAAKEGKKSVVWPSENLPARSFYNGLIHTLTGKPIEREYGDKRLTAEEYRRAQLFIRDHILVIDPPTGYPYSPLDILAYFEAGINRMGPHTAHCMYDPWNKGDHTAKFRKFGGSDEAYIAHTLGIFTKWSQDTGQCLVLTAHPKRPTQDLKYGEIRPVATGAHISGGQMWENAPHMVCGIQRPYHHNHQHPNATAAAFYTFKCKDERNVARVGNVGAIEADGMPPVMPINWDEPTQRYRWGHAKTSPFDAEDIKKIWQVPKATQTQPLLPFTPTATAPQPPAPATAPERLPPLTVASDFDSIPDDMLPGGARPVRLPNAAQ